MGKNQKQGVFIILFVIVGVLAITLNGHITQLANAQTMPATDTSLETSLPLTLTAISTTITSLETTIPITLTALSTSIPEQPVFTPTLNTQCPNPIVTNPTLIGFDFEIGIECWNTSEESYKLAQLDVTSLIAHSGARSLVVTTELFGDRSPQVAKITDKNKREVYQHTEVTAYFGSAIPEGYSTPGPYDLTGKTLSCFVYLPSQLTIAGRPWPYVRIFAKDAGYANLFGQALDIDTTQVNKWIQLSLVVKSQGDFDATLTNAIGIRIETKPGSKLRYIGPIFIDDCTIG